MFRFNKNSNSNINELEKLKINNKKTLSFGMN